MPTRILFTIESYLPRIGGAEIHLFKLRQQLHKKGYLSKVITTESLKPKIKEDDIIRLKYNDIASLINTIGKEVKQADIIHSHYSSKLAVIAGLWSKWYKKPFVITEQGFGILDIASAGLISLFFHRLYRAVSIKLADRIITTSDELTDLVRKYTRSDKVITISNGVDKIEKVPIKRPRYRIATMRRLVNKNGVHYLVQATPYILKKIPKLKIDLYGDGYNRKRILATIKKLKLEKVVTIKGELPHDKVLKTLTKYEAVIFPSTAEARSLACLEAMMAGCIVVASNVGGLTELVGKKNQRGYLSDFLKNHQSTYTAAWTLPGKKLKLFATDIIDALKDSNRNRKVIAARIYVSKHFTWEKITDKNIAIYDQITR